MTHVLPIFCLLVFIYFLEIRIKHELMEVEQKFKILKEEILKNREKIKENKEVISKMNG
mgnify:FL=1